MNAAQFLLLLDAVQVSQDAVEFGAHDLVGHFLADVALHFHAVVPHHGNGEHPREG